MCINANSQHAHLRVNKQVIDELYAHLEGDQIARGPQKELSIATLRMVERDVWRKLALQVHSTKGLTLEKAITELIGNSFYWTMLLLGGPTGKGNFAVGAEYDRGYWPLEIKN